MSFFKITQARYVTSFALEGALVIGVLYVLVQLNALLMPMPIIPFETKGTFVSLNGLVFVGGFLVTRRAVLGEAANLRRELVILGFVSILFGLVALLGWFAYSGSGAQLPALLIAEGVVAVPATVAGWRWIALRYQVLDGYRERILIVGTGETAKQVARLVSEQLSGDYRVVAFADEEESLIGQVLAKGVRVMTTFGELERFSSGRVDRIIVALEEKRGKLPIRELMHLRLSGVEIEEATSFFERASGKLVVESMLPSWLVYSEGFKASPVRRVVKRASDVGTSVLLLLLAAPAMALTAIAIAIDSGRPVLYRQRRMGRNGVEFDMLKFRSMVQDAEQKSGPTWAGRDDPRVTRVGKLIRKLRIDELPQLINVLRGEMSFVGPRPERRHFVQQLEKEIHYYSLRMSVRPGITGWAQVEYRYGSSVEDALEKLKYDLFYIKNSNFLYDVWILIKTVKVVLTTAGAR